MTLLSVSKAVGGLPESTCQTWTRSLRARAATATLRLPFRAKSFQPHWPRAVARPMQNGLSSLDEESIMGVDAYKVHIVNIISIASIINWGTFKGLGDEDATSAW